MLVFVPSMLTLLLEYVQLEQLPAAQMLTNPVPGARGVLRFDCQGPWSYQSVAAE